MRIRVVIAICIVYSAAAFAAAEAAVLPKTAELVPAETVVLVDISDVNQLVGKFEKSPVYKLYKDPAMSAFVENLTGKWREKTREEKDPVIKTILNAHGLPEGRVAFAWVLTPNTGRMQGPVFLVISQWGKNVGEIKKAIDKAIAEAVERGAHRSIEDYRDVNMVTLTTEAAPQRVPDLEGHRPEDGNITYKTVQPPPERTVYCFIDDCLIAGTDVDTVKFAVARIKGAGGSSLAADSEYVAAMGAVGPYHDVDFYVNLKQIISRIVAEDTSGEARMTMSNLGFDNVGGLGCSLGVGATEGSSLYGKAFLRTAGSRKGILKMLEARTAAVRPPRFIPASAYSVSFLNLDIRRAYDELVSIIYGFNPAAATAMQAPLVAPEAEGEPAISLRTDIIEYLGSEVVIAQSANKPFSTGEMPSETLIAVSISNRAALEKSISLVHKRLMVPYNPEPSRELLGHTIYMLGPVGIPVLGGAVPMAEVPSQREVPPGAKMAFTITDTHLILGPEPAVERAIRTLAGADSEPIGSAEWFAAAKSAVPSVVGLACFEDNAASGEILWWMLKENTKNRRADFGMGPAAAVLAGHDLWDLADFNLLPEFDAVRKYFGCSAFYGITRADGFLFEFKSLDKRTK
ncbi:MAG: hypothetical protein ABII09_03890 [Planctomycetota bacterium]